MRERPDVGAATPFVAANPLGVVPIVPFENRATILGGGVSELEDCIPLLRRIDKLTLDLLLTSRRRRVPAEMGDRARGAERPRDRQARRAVQSGRRPAMGLGRGRTRNSARSRRPTSANTCARSRRDVAALCAIIARAGALPHAVEPREPADRRVARRAPNPGSSRRCASGNADSARRWERADGARARARRRDERRRSRSIWQDAEMRNPAQVADAAVKLQTIGVPQRALWEYVGATPQQIAEWGMQSAAAALTAPPAPAPPAPTPAAASGAPAS